MLPKLPAPPRPAITGRPSEGPAPSRDRRPGRDGTGRGEAAARLTFSSTQLTMMEGYLRLSQRKKAGTPMAERRTGAAGPRLSAAALPGEAASSASGGKGQRGVPWGSARARGGAGGAGGARGGRRGRSREAHAAGPPS